MFFSRPGEYQQSSSGNPTISALAFVRPKFNALQSPGEATTRSICVFSGSESMILDTRSSEFWSISSNSKPRNV